MSAVEDTSAERERLVGLVENTHALLGRIVSRHPRWIPRRLRRNFNVAIQDLATAVQQTTDRLRADLDSPHGAELTQTLATVGLSGTQLELKAMIADRARKTFEDTAITVFQKEFASKTAAESALDAANVPLETLGKVIPPAGAITEVKHGLEWALKNTGVLRKGATLFYKGLKLPVKAVKRLKKPKAPAPATPA